MYVCVCAYARDKQTSKHRGVGTKYERRDRKTDGQKEERKDLLSVKGKAGQEERWGKYRWTSTERGKKS